MTKYGNDAGETLYEFKDDEDGLVELTFYYTEPDEFGDWDEPSVSVLSVPELIILREALDKEIAKRV